MALCGSPGQLRRSTFTAIEVLLVATAWFAGGNVFAAPGAGAQYDPATPDLYQSPSGSGDPAVQQRYGRPSAPQGIDDQDDSRPQWRSVRRQQPRRGEASQVERAAFETDSPPGPAAAPRARIAQGGPAFREEYLQDENGPGVARTPLAGCGSGPAEYGDYGDVGCGWGEDCGSAIPGCCREPAMERLWVRGEYLLWWMPGFNVPALVTTSPAGTPRSQAGRLGQPGTSILFGDSALNDGAGSGGRVTLGGWLTPCHLFGIEGSYLGIGTQTAQFNAQSSDFPILARPFYDIQSGSQGQDAALVSFPGVASGSVAVTGTSQFQAADVLSRARLLEQCDLYVDFLLGYRYGQLQDGLLINELTTSLSREGPAPLNTTFQVVDRFDTQNQFNGGVVGVAFQEHYCGWSLDILMKLALGSTHTRIAIDGTTTTTVPGTVPVTYAGGILAQPTNIGVYEQNFFTVMPELGVAVGYDLTCRLRVTCGYTVLYWSKVARPGDQIDTELNPSQFPSQYPPGLLVGAPHPQFALRTTDFSAQGLNVGLEYRF